MKTNHKVALGLVVAVLGVLFLFAAERDAAVIAKSAQETMQEQRDCVQYLYEITEDGDYAIKECAVRFNVKVTEIEENLP